MSLTKKNPSLKEHAIETTERLSLYPKAPQTAFSLHCNNKTILLALILLAADVSFVFNHIHQIEHQFESILALLLDSAITRTCITNVTDLISDV